MENASCHHLAARIFRWIIAFLEKSVSSWESCSTDFEGQYTPRTLLVFDTRDQSDSMQVPGIYLINEQKHPFVNPTTWIYLCAERQVWGILELNIRKQTAWKYSYVDNTCHVAGKAFRPSSWDASHLWKGLKTKTRATPKVPRMSKDWNFSLKMEYVNKWWLTRGCRKSITFPKPHKRK